MCTARQLSTRQPLSREVGRGGGFWLRFHKQSAGETMEEPGLVQSAPMTQRRSGLHPGIPGNA